MGLSGVYFCIKIVFVWYLFWITVLSLSHRTRAWVRAFSSMKMKQVESVLARCDDTEYVIKIEKLKIISFSLLTLIFLLQNCFQKLVKRMTRFFVKTNIEQSVVRLKIAVEKFGYTWKSFTNNVVSFSLSIENSNSLILFNPSNYRVADNCSHYWSSKVVVNF